MTTDPKAEAKPPLGPGYRRLWLASVISNLGDGVASIAYPWLATEVTRNPLHIALVGVASRLPWLLFSLPAGAVTDRVDRRRLVGGMDAARFMLTAAVALAVLADRDLGSPAALLSVLYVGSFLLGVGEVFRDNAAQTLMPSLVPKERLEDANGRLWAAEGIMNQFVGPPLAGLLLAVSISLPFFVDAATFGVAALLVLSLSGSFHPSRGAGRGDGRDGFAGMRADIAEGVRWLWSHRLLRTMALILGAMNGLASAGFAIIVLIVQERFGLGGVGFGALMATAAVGGTVGSALASKVSSGLGSGPSLFVVLLGIGLASAGLALTSSMVVFGVLLAIEGFLGVLWNVITVSFRQSIIPDHLLGRVNSVYRLLAWGSIPLGSLLGGLLVTGGEAVFDRETGLRFPFAVAALGHLALLAWALPNLTTAKMDAARAEASTAAP